MSRAACSVENSGSWSPYLAPQPSAIFLFSAAIASNWAWLTGSGGAAKLASWSVSLMHLIGSDRPTPRGSKPMTSNWSVISVGRPPSVAPNER